MTRPPTDSDGDWIATAIALLGVLACVALAVSGFFR